MDHLQHLQKSMHHMGNSSYPDHSSLYMPMKTDPSHLIYFLWAVFIVAQDCTIDVGSLAVFPRWINWTN